MSGDHSSRTQPPRSSRARRITAQKTLVITALVTFAVSLCLPAIRFTSGESPFPGGAVYGIQCVISSKAHYPSNAFLLLLAPLACWLARQWRRPWVWMIVTAIAVTSFAFAVATRLLEPLWKSAVAGETMSLGIGFWAWVLAHALMTAAVAMPVWGVDPDDAALADERRRLREKWLPAKRAA